MKELSIFIDESGDFGKYSPHSPYYIISMVFHDQSVDINESLNTLEWSLNQIDLENHYIHSGPIIRAEGEYRNMDINKRKTILRRISTFVRKTEINYKCFCVEKKIVKQNKDIVKLLKESITLFINDNHSFLSRYDVIKIYYDNGQSELKRLLVEVFDSFFTNMEYKLADKNKHRLMEVADYICTIKLIEQKIKTNTITKSEEKVLGSGRVIKKNYIKPLLSKEINSSKK